MRIPTYQKFTKYHFHDVLKGLSKHMMDIKFIKEKIEREHERRFYAGVASGDDLDSNVNFEDVINDMQKKVSIHKIAMYENMKKVN